MSPNEATMATFEARMRQLILQFQSLKEENKELYAMLEKSEEENKRIVAELNDVKKRMEYLDRLQKQAKLFEDNEVKVLNDKQSFYGPDLPF